MRVVFPQFVTTVNHVVNDDTEYNALTGLSVGNTILNLDDGGSGNWILNEVTAITDGDIGTSTVLTVSSEVALTVQNLEQTLAEGNTSGANDQIMSDQQKLQFNVAGNYIHEESVGGPLAYAASKGHKFITGTATVEMGLNDFSAKKSGAGNGEFQMEYSTGSLRYTDNDTTFFGQINMFPITDNRTWTAPDESGTLLTDFQKGIANGIVPLNGSTKIDSTYLPSYVDDVLDFANLAAFPGTGETGKIYMANDTNKLYRWSGAVYIEVSSDVMETATSMGALVNSLTPKATPVDADMIGLMDSAAANIWKKLSWANVKATLKTYFDTIYKATFTENTAFNKNFGTGAGTVMEGNQAAGGDVTGTLDSITIANNAVTNAKAADMAAWTLKMRNNAGAGDPQDVKISALTDGTFGSGDKMIIEESTGELRKIDYDDLPGAGGGGLTVVSPASINADVNDYSPAGFAPNVILRQDVGGGFTQEIRGFDSSGFSDGDVFYISNISADENLKVIDSSVLSAAANRVVVIGDLQVDKTGTVGFWYDGTSSRWRPLTERT